MTRVVLSLVLFGCAAPASPPHPRIRKVEQLGALMKNDVNPAFSKLAFFLAHADTMDEDPRTVRSEIEIAGANLQSAIGRLRMWHDPPTDSVEGREVFLTYAASIDAMTQKMLDAIGRDERAVALDQLEKIADTCNNCHHFFRLDIEDSVVKRTAAR